MGVPPDVTLQLAFSWQVRLPQGSARLMLQVAPVYPAGHEQDMDDPVAVHTPPFEQGAGTALQGSSIFLGESVLPFILFSQVAP